jgi:tellurite resistance protein
LSTIVEEDSSEHGQLHTLSESDSFEAVVATLLVPEKGNLVKREYPIPSSLFSVVLGLSGLGQAWRAAASLWHLPHLVSEFILFTAALVWLGLLTGYIFHAVRHPARTAEEFRNPVAGSTPALLGISTLLISLAALPYSRPTAWVLVVAGIAWHILFSVWHTSTLWQGGRSSVDTVPTLYLPTVAGNFTCAAGLGALGETSWAWLFFGAGLFSWLALESLIIRRLWHDTPLQVAQRPLLGIQFAPPVVCASALLLIAPDSAHEWTLMLLGYGLFQMLICLRLRSWLTEHPFGSLWWAFSFGSVSATVTCVKLAVANIPAASSLALPVFALANVFIGYLCLRSIGGALGALTRHDVCRWTFKP